MRYIDIGGYVIPKHCKYGPRPAEGLVFTSQEWWNIRDHLVKGQQERELLALQKAKEEAKKAISLGMTRNWNNTLASIKTLGNQKRMEKKEKEKQDKIDEYNEILRNRSEERKKYLEDLRKVLYEEKDSSKTINSMIFFSAVLQERQKQIELKNLLKSEQDKKDLVWAKKFKEDAEDFKQSNFNEILKEKASKRKQKADLDKQMEDIKLRRQAEAEEFAKEKQDLINMKNEEEKIKLCDLTEKNFRKSFAARYIKKTEYQLELEKKMRLEQEEEDEVNKMYESFHRKFQKKRKEREQKIMKDRVEQRIKNADRLAQKLKAAAKEEEDRMEAALVEKETREEREQEARDNKKKQALADMLQSKKEAEEAAKRKHREFNERKKWEMMQVYRSAERDEEWRSSRRKRLREEQAKTRATYDEQCRQLEERRAEELRERWTPPEDQTAVKEDLLRYCRDATDFVKEHNMPAYPLLRAIAVLKKEHNIRDGQETEKNAKEEEETKDGCSKKPKQGPLGTGCYCLKY